MIVEFLENNEFHQMPYQSHSIQPSKVIEENPWRLLSPVKLSSSDFMLELFVRQTTISHCSELASLPGGEFLRIGDNFNSTKMLIFNKKYGDRMSMSFNGFMNTTNDIFFRKVLNNFVSI